MKKFGFATVVAGALVAAILGLAAPAQAVAAVAPTGVTSAINIPTDLDHHSWLDQIGPHVTVPHVDTSVHQSR